MADELQAVATGLASLKTAFDISKSLLDIPGAVKTQAKVIELQSQILAAQNSAMEAQQTQSALLDRIKKLEAEIARLEEWDANKDDYKLQNVGSGSFVYSPKAEPTAEQPNYWLCVKCFERGHRSVLQNQGRPPGHPTTRFLCPTCETGFHVDYRNGPHRRGEAMSDGTRHA